MKKIFDSQNNSLRAIIAAIATIGIVGTALAMGTQLVSLLMAEKGLSNSTIGYSGTVGGIATIIAAIFTSQIALCLGITQTILLMMAIGSLSFLGFYFFESIWVWFILRFILHFTMTVMFILSEFWINSYAPPKKRGLVLSIYAIVLGLGFALGPTLLTKVGIQGFIPFGVGYSLIILATIPILFAWKLSPEFQKSQYTPFFRYLLHVPSAMMAVLVYGAIQMGALTLITPFSLSIGYNENEAAHFMATLALGNVFLLIPISIISDYAKDRRYPLIGCAILGFVGTFTVPWIIQYPWILMLDLFLLGGVSASLYTIGLAHLGARLKGQELAAANSAFIFCYGIGMLIGPTFIGKSMDIFNPFGFSIAMAVFFGLYVMLVLVQLMRKLISS
ncbi:MFS transporter [Bartonella tribocorum]|uniref:Major facilitator family transporter n=1 Tax=Bartonella tribocorum (strain DSM 28219 / CCUG 45778 / CIP 105476 / IBS 506) TaxID=382640 RepID=A9IU30_BART1|nr:MFS transporter [Bartonella tribocorum]CAK01505.1 major facilitator family transporter [Bartonella tribocorum CIP 105476]CDO48748.1 major facilitator family transporter [Bartonella tribocorum]